jgi:hypothetical protein
MCDFVDEHAFRCSGSVPCQTHTLYSHIDRIHLTATFVKEYSAALRERSLHSRLDPFRPKILRTDLDSLPHTDPSYDAGTDVDRYGRWPQAELGEGEVCPIMGLEKLVQRIRPDVLVSKGQKAFCTMFENEHLRHIVHYTSPRYTSNISMMNDHNLRCALKTPREILVGRTQGRFPRHFELIIDGANEETFDRIATTLFQHITPEHNSGNQLTVWSVDIEIDTTAKLRSDDQHFVVKN